MQQQITDIPGVISFLPMSSVPLRTLMHFIRECSTITSSDFLCADGILFCKFCRWCVGNNYNRPASVQTTNACHTPVSVTWKCKNRHSMESVKHTLSKVRRFPSASINLFLCQDLDLTSCSFVDHFRTRPLRVTEDSRTCLLRLHGE